MVEFKATAGKVGDRVVKEPDGLSLIMLRGWTSSGKGFVEELVVFEESLLEERELWGAR